MSSIKPTSLYCVAIDLQDLVAELVQELEFMEELPADAFATMLHNISEYIQAIDDDLEHLRTDDEVLQTVLEDEDDEDDDDEA